MIVEIISTSIKNRINKYLIRNIRRFYNTIYYKLRNPDDFIIVNCSFKQWGAYIVPFNFGDDINAVLLNFLSGKKVLNIDEFFHKPMINLMGIGSIIDWKSNNKSIVWGSGIMNDKSVIVKQRKPMKVIAVRGLLSKKILERNGISCPNVFGDPALLLPKVYRPKVKKTELIGVIPHYVDLTNPILMKFINDSENVKLIDIQHYNKWKDIVDQICSCKYVVSSSLHGIILSDAYGIPNVWVKFSDNISGGEFKFYDYFSAVGRNERCVDVRNGIDLLVINNIVCKYEGINFNHDLLMSTFPSEEFVRNES